MIRVAQILETRPDSKFCEFARRDSIEPHEMRARYIKSQIFMTNRHQ